MTLVVLYPTYLGHGVLFFLLFFFFFHFIYFYFFYPVEVLILSKAVHRRGLKLPNRGVVLVKNNVAPLSQPASGLERRIYAIFFVVRQCIA